MLVNLEFLNNIRILNNNNIPIINNNIAKYHGWRRFDDRHSKWNPTVIEDSLYDMWASPDKELVILAETLIYEKYGNSANKSD